MGDTVQLSREVSYPYDYKIEENEATRENITYTQRYLSGGDTMTAVISKRIARIESIE